MAKVVINSRYGGFGLSGEACHLYEELSGRSDFYDRDIPRNDPILVQVVQKLGEKANDGISCLRVVEIPDDVEWYISDYDGIESVEEVHRTWS